MSARAQSGMRIVLDPEEGFKECLPRTGTIGRLIKEGSTDASWFVVELDEPVECQMKIGEPYQFRLIKSDELLIRSRWQGHEVGADEPTSVHVLLPLRDNLSKQITFDLKDAYHVGWAGCKRA